MIIQQQVQHFYQRVRKSTVVYLKLLLVLEMHVLALPQIETPEESPK